MNRIRFAHAGFTLIEVLMYLAIFSIAIVGISEAAYALLESAGRNQTQAMLQEEGDFLLAHIDDVLNNAQSISIPTANGTASSLVTNQYDGSQETLRLYGGNLIDNGAQLNNTNVSVADLDFVRTNETIEAGITMSAKTPNGFNVFWSASTTRAFSP